MASESQVLRLITERRRRLVATVMGYAEREIFEQLSDAQQADFRRKIIGAIDDFADLMRDVIKVTSEESVVNDHALRLLEQIHDSQRALVKRLS